MSGIFSFFGAFCVGSVIFGALYILLPEGSLKEPVRYVFCLCFICLLLSSVSFSFKKGIDYTAENSAADVADLSGKTAELTFKTALKKAGINFTDLKVLTSKNASGGIDIIEVVVYSPDSPQKITEAIGNNGYGVSVINE